MRSHEHTRSSHFSIIRWGSTLEAKLLKELVARQSRPRQQNSWRFRAGLAYVGESALSTGQGELS